LNEPADDGEAEGDYEGDEFDQFEGVYDGEGDEGEDEGY